MHALEFVSRIIDAADRTSQRPINLVASIESARALWDVGRIAGWVSSHPSARLTALLVGVYIYMILKKNSSRPSVRCGGL